VTGQIGGAVDAMETITQQNAALVEETSAAAESLTDQTAQLSRALRVFKLAGNAAKPAAEHPPLALAR